MASEAKRLGSNLGSTTYCCEMWSKLRGSPVPRLPCASVLYFHLQMVIDHAGFDSVYDCASESMSHIQSKMMPFIAFCRKNLNIG